MPLKSIRSHVWHVPELANKRACLRIALSNVSETPTGIPFVAASILHP
jgi:hypothetical protein